MNDSPSEPDPWPVTRWHASVINVKSVKEMAAIVNAGGPPDVEKVKGVMLKHGLVPVMPQMASDKVGLSAWPPRAM